MKKFTEVFNQLIDQSFGQISGFFTQHGPALVFAFVIILLGWVLAIIIRKLCARLLRALGFDVLLEKTGIDKIIKRGGIDTKPSTIFSWFIYWVILVNAIFMAQDALDLKVTTQFLSNILNFIPNLIIVAILLSLGTYVGNIIAKVAEKTALMANIPFSKFIGIMTRYAVIGTAVIMSLDVINDATSIVIDSVRIIFIYIPAIILVAFLLGGRDVITNMLDGRFLKEMLKKGDNIEVGDVKGEIISIGAAATLLKTDYGEAIIPNAEISKNIIKKKNGQQASV